VKNGVVIFRDGHPLEEGTIVRIEAVKTPRQEIRPGSREAMLQCDARWVGDAKELDQLLIEVQNARDADLTPLGSSE
jgi:hypothetical protein